MNNINVFNVKSIVNIADFYKKTNNFKIKINKFFSLLIALNKRKTPKRT